MIEITRLEAMDISKLVDIVKNYRQYGYDDELRKKVLAILETRGVNEDELKMTGNFSNYKYDTATDLASTFFVNSRWTFIFYVINIFISLVYLVIPIAETVAVVCYLLSLICFFVFMIRSFLNRNDFYKTIGKDLVFGDYLIYLMTGISVYLFMYFYYRTQMKEELQMIR